MRAHAEDIDLARVAFWEQRLRHDVMAHVRHFGEVAPAAHGVIHLGATSAYVTDNTEVLQHRAALLLLRSRLVAAWPRWPSSPRAGATCPAWASRTSSRRSPPRSASAPRSGCRTCCWTWRSSSTGSTTVRFRGARGTTGTEASFLELFDGDGERVDALNERIAAKMGFERLYGGHGPDLSAQGGLRLSRHARRHRRIRIEDRARHPPAAAPEGSGGAVRGGAGRLLRDGLQAQPDAQRADHVAGAARPGAQPRSGASPPPRSGWSARSTIPRTGGSRSRRRTSGVDAILLLLHNVTAGLVVRPAVIAAAPGRRAAVHGDRGDPDGRREARRRPAAAARAHPPCTRWRRRSR